MEICFEPGKGVTGRSRASAANPPTERRASLGLTRDRLLAVALGVVSYGPRLQLRVTVWAVRENSHCRSPNIIHASEVSFSRCRSIVGA